MTDTTTARPAPPAWLNIDAIIAPALRHELHAHAEPSRLGWLRPMVEWMERALTLDEEYGTALIDTFDGTVPDAPGDAVDAASGWSTVYDVVCLLEEIHNGFDLPRDGEYRADRVREWNKIAAELLGSD